ncbi:MAG: GTPase ObgE [Elusimicrobia bacterium]|nr:GTPase ObgE [Elusimicrobiota bacterium]
MYTNFIDRVRLFAKAGCGGAGCLSFRREKFIEFGGPNGGDGGKGGDVYLEATPELSTLLDLSRNPHVKGNEGSPGKGSNKTGAAGADVVLRVPVGTVVYRVSGASKDGGGARMLAADLTAAGARYLAARGGRGGRGNQSFKSRFNTAPRIAEKGEPGDCVTLDLELKLIADVGLVGLPNAGKSTLLACVSAARPKIADYPFTTLAPNLGVVVHKRVQFTVADIPGLIEGAAEGKGLGTAFLRHVERTRMLLHLVDPFGCGEVDAARGVRVIEAELKASSPRLLRKSRLLVVNKMDLTGSEAALKALRSRCGKRDLLAVSAATGAGVGALLDRVIRELARHPAPDPSAERAAPAGPVRVPSGFGVRDLGEGRFALTGSFVTRAASMLKSELPEAVERFQAVLKRIGVDRALRAAGVREGDTVLCGSLQFEWSEAPQGRRRLVNRRERSQRRKLTRPSLRGGE